MRKFIISRIDEFKNSVDGCEFNKKMMRWRNVEFEGKHVSEVDYSLLPDDKLLAFYERIIRQLSKCIG